MSEMRNRMWKIVLIMLLIESTADINYGAKKTFILPNLDKPGTIVMDNNRVYIEDGPTVKLYSRQDYRFLKTIGKVGQGPGDFLGYATPQILDNKLLISSDDKISYFTLSGDFILDKRQSPSSYLIKAINDKYIGYVWVFRGDYIAYNLYDSNFKKIKELHRGKPFIHSYGQHEYFKYVFYDIYKDNIILAHRNGLSIEILDSKGNVCSLIELKTEPIPFTKKHKNQTIKAWQESGLDESQVQRLEKKTIFPDFFPAIQECRLSDDLILIITYATKKKKYECLVYNMKGEKIKNVYLPLKMISPSQAFPFTISNDDFFQLIYNYDLDEWELHISRIY